MMARTASMSGFQSSVSVIDLPPSRHGRFSSPVHDFKICRCSLHPLRTMEDKMLSRLNCRAAITKTNFCCFDHMQVPIQRCHASAKLRKGVVRLFIAEAVINASRMAAGPCGVHLAHGFPKCFLLLCFRSCHATQRTSSCRLRILLLQLILSHLRKLAQLHL